MSYKSPIEIAIGQLRFEQEKRLESEIMTAIQAYDITIDRDNLVKALRYDREQYNKGYEDGYRYAVREMQERVKALCAVDMVAILRCVDQIAKEMLEETE